MRQLIGLVLAGFLVGVFATSQPAASHEDKPAQAAPPSGVKLENLLKAELEGAKGIEVIVSRVTLLPNTSLPKHWHPGEEFAYVLDGSVVLWQDGKPEVVGVAGAVMQVPLKQVHTAMTQDEGATILVFRVHEQGKPERVLVD